MGNLDSIVKLALEAASKASPEHGELANSVLGFIQAQGGIEGIQKKFEEKGYGDVIASWISNSDNLPISGADLIKIFGSKPIADIASKAGLSEEGASDKIATVLPVLLNGLTPEGKVTGGDLLDVGLGFLKKGLF